MKGLNLKGSGSLSSEVQEVGGPQIFFFFYVEPASDLSLCQVVLFQRHANIVFICVSTSNLKSIVVLRKTARRDFMSFTVLINTESGEVYRPVCV